MKNINKLEAMDYILFLFFCPERAIALA